MRRSRFPPPCLVRKTSRLLPALCLTVTVFAEPRPYPLFYESPAPFRAAIASADKTAAPLTQKITGITVPHHLLAADMIAATFRLASGHQPARIVILSPDHFRRGTTPLATTTRPFQSPLGGLAIDLPAASKLLENTLVAESNLFSHEHGVQALLPFIAHYFPKIPVVPLAIDIRSTPEEWEMLATIIQAIITPDTLMVQSTDFSHYLSQLIAAVHDQQTLMLLAAGDRAGIRNLSQPDHLDSKAAQWLQMTLQHRIFKALPPVVVDNRNAIRYGGRPDEPRTTSYITQLHSAEFIPAAGLPGAAWFFGGDTHFGRHVATAFADSARAANVAAAVLTITGARPLIVNLEGVVLDEAPSEFTHPMRIGMAAEFSIAQLKRLHVAAVSIANNHALDFGKAARHRMRELLENAGIKVIDAGPPSDLGPFRLAVATDVVNRPEPATAILTEASFAAWRQPASAKPLIAFLHSGREYADAPSPRERRLAGWAETAGAALILGSHPHRPSPGWERGEKSLRFPSLGNLIFDQIDPKNTGGLIEVRFFEQGTWAARWQPVGNLYLHH